MANEKPNAYQAPNGSEVENENEAMSVVYECDAEVTSEVVNAELPSAADVEEESGGAAIEELIDGMEIDDDALAEGFIELKDLAGNVGFIELNDLTMGGGYIELNDLAEPFPGNKP